MSLENTKNFNRNESITMKTQSYIMSTIQNTSLFVIMSIVTKILNLFFNVLIARIISKESYGLATVYFIFIYMLILHFPRELLRKTCLKYCPDEREERENEKFREACQLSWIINFFILLLSFPVLFIFIKFGGGNGDTITSLEFAIHLVLYKLSAFMELISEPVVIYLNIKIDKTNRLLALAFSHYARLILNYFFAWAYGFDLWSFTLSRVFSSLLYLLFMLYVGLCHYQLKFRTLLPNFLEMGIVYQNNHLKGILFSSMHGTALKLVFSYSERIVLSFILDTSDNDKAEYTFVLENYSTFIKYLIEPAEENFYNLINKIKHYKGLTVVPSDSDEFMGDFSHSENEILIKLYSSFKNKKMDKESYSYKLLKLWLKLFFAFGILLSGYIYVIGKELILTVYTEKWGTYHTIVIFKIYSIYVAIIAISGIVESYANAICSTERIHKAHSFMTFNSILLVFLSMTMGRYDTTGLIIANSIVMILRFFYNTYQIISTELEFQFNLDNHNTEGGIIEFAQDNYISQISESYEDKNQGVEKCVSHQDQKRLKLVLSAQCIKYTQIFQEFIKFFSKSFIKVSALFATIVCLLFISLAKDVFYEDENQIFIMIISILVLGINTILIFLLEKKGFIEIFRLRTSGLKSGFI